jgi:MFS family permease
MWQYALSLRSEASHTALALLFPLPASANRASTSSSTWIPLAHVSHPSPKKNSLSSLWTLLTERSKDTANIVGAVNALFSFGAAIGAIAQGYIADWLGRKKALAIAAVFALIGGALAAGSVAIAMLIVVRILQGCGLGMLLCLVPLYLTEVAPPHRRGFLTGLTTMSFGLGYTR